ncbi:substrate-binding periplasmic protein [Hahella ganghwensis]|uniref:substrate-binding periplasmic protein n=1 Tax=Hahella ganghwensis TaxID=286420 RepID=UPI0003714FB0|nr:transporter substrate-binding domain-containing protein [Hahella ganghwensis]
MKLQFLIVFFSCLIVFPAYGEEHDPTFDSRDLPDLPSRHMTIAFAENYPPFSWSEGKHEVKGILKDILHEVLEDRLGLSVSYDTYPWARGQQLVREGLVDAFFTIPNSDRLTYTEVSLWPLFASDYYMYTGKNNPNIPVLKEITTLAELKTHSYLTHSYILGGGWHGENLGDVENKWIEQDSKKILKLLEFNRADVYIEQRPLMHYQMKILGYKDEILEMPAQLDTTKWHLCISKKSPYTIILPMLNDLLGTLATSGELRKINQKIFDRYR